MKTSDLIWVIFLYIMTSFHDLAGLGKGGLEISFWDVGQGDAIFITTPGGKSVLIDGGDNYESDFKLSREMPFYSCNIDVLILTHPHYDHINGLSRIMQRCRIGVVMFNDVDFASRDFYKFKDLSGKFDIKNIVAGQMFEIDNIKFKILWPSKEFLQKGFADINDVSTVVFMDYGNFEALFTGDATDKVLGNIDYNEIYPFVEDGFDVLKVPHHGSKYSLHKNFYSKLKPKKCVISVGAGNKFGHPSSDVIKYLEDSGCEVLRTDFLGDIKMKIF